MSKKLTIEKELSRKDPELYDLGRFLYGLIIAMSMNRFAMECRTLKQ